MQPTPKPAMSGLKPPTYGIAVDKIQTSVGRINKRSVFLFGLNHPADFKADS
jgi:hypothetical protein